MRITPIMIRRKAEKLAKLTERYEGKRDLLATWDQLFPGRQHHYRNDLKRRVVKHYYDLTYRGGDPDHDD